METTTIQSDNGKISGMDGNSGNNGRTSVHSGYTRFNRFKLLRDSCDGVQFFRTSDRQWDMRVNIPDEEYLKTLIAKIRQDIERGRIQYILVGGIEIGTKPTHSDYQQRHVHIAVIFVNKITGKALSGNWNLGNGVSYYIRPRDRSLPYTGWRNHHIKEHTKVDKEKCIIFEDGKLPNDVAKAVDGQYTKRSDEEKKRKLDEILIDMRDMLEKDQDEEAFKKYPRNYLLYGERLKAAFYQKRDKLQSTGDPHIWLHGPAGCGKSAVLNFIYPNYYKKNLYNRFFDLYDPKQHTHIMLEDLDHDAVDKLSTNFLKTICDEHGFPIDQKYKTPQLARSTILVTSNFTIHDVIWNSDEANVFGKAENAKAIQRRFWMVSAKEFLRLLDLKLISKYELDVLKKNGNNDPSKLFIHWDYVQDIPKAEPIKTPEEYREIIKNKFYAL